MFGFKMTTPPSSGYQEGVVDEIVLQGKAWRVKFAASYWPATSVHPAVLLPGDRVRVVGRDNITLLIDPTAALDSHLKQSAQEMRI